MSKDDSKRTSGITGKRISSRLISDMFDMFLLKKSLQEIHRVTGVSASTVAKYRDRDGWIKRRELIDKKAIQRADSKTVTVQSRQISLARAMQQVGGKRLLTLKDDDISARDAKDFIKDGVLLERTLCGEGEQVIQITIKMPAGLEDI